MIISNRVIGTQCIVVATTSSLQHSRLEHRGDDIQVYSIGHYFYLLHIPVHNLHMSQPSTWHLMQFSQNCLIRCGFIFSFLAMFSFPVLALAFSWAGSYARLWRCAVGQVVAKAGCALSKTQNTNIKHKHMKSETKYKTHPGYDRW